MRRSVAAINARCLRAKRAARARSPHDGWQNSSRPWTFTKYRTQRGTVQAVSLSRSGPDKKSMADRIYPASSLARASVRTDRRLAKGVSDQESCGATGSSAAMLFTTDIQELGGSLRIILVPRSCRGDVGDSDVTQEELLDLQRLRCVQGPIIIV
ncbi:hypothetical protein OG256_43800 [Streptomyces sp. NBC_00564]|nr:hypothetical protein OG256_43800 [Streptomyces sp. NBC_00564]